MALSTGRHLGPYEIVAPLGAGGMGEVYRARDSGLNRDVALKVLPEQFALDSDRLARFGREAQVLASLNHPNIAAIYGLEEADGIRALVLELVEGPTLEDRIAQGALPLDEALSMARQIAEALESAHEQGIVHRDLKPANIKIAHTGIVKVLDFGLAKIVTGDVPGPDLSRSPTITTGSTREGVILGTIAYMSPEQARGKPLDKRTDIWSFGCVLYEMLTGRRAFAGETLPDTIAATLGREPNWRELPDDTPSGVRRLLERCLQKDPRRRLHDIADARIELDEAMAGTPASVTRTSRSHRGVLAALVGVALAAGIGIGAFLGPRAAPEPSPPRDVRANRLTDLAGLEEFPAISPDGRSVAFAADVDGWRQVFVRLIAGGAPLQLTRGSGDHQLPRWSPDSSSITYFVPATRGEPQGTIWEISALGGPPRRITSSLGAGDVNLVDGRMAYFRLAEGRVQLVSARSDTSSLEVVAQLPPVTYYLYPRWSPDGKSIAFQRGDSPRFDVFVVSAGGGEPWQLTRDNSMISGFAWLPDSTGIIYSSSRGSTMPYLPTMGLWEMSLRGGRLRQVTSGETSYTHPDIGRNGALVASRMRLQSDIWKFPVDGPPEENVRRGVRVTRQTGHVLTPTAAPDGKQVAFLSDSGGHANLWVVDTESGELRQITHERDPGVAVGAPVWSPDGTSIAFVCTRGNPGLTFGVWLVNPDGSSLRRLANPGLGPAWSPDGGWLYYSTRGSAAVTDIEMKKIPARGGAAVTVTTERLRNVIGSDGSTVYYTFERPLVDGRPDFEIRAATPENAPFRVLARISGSRIPVWQIVNPALSPDGRWLAQALTDGFTTNIWALSTTTGQWRQITDFGKRATFIARRVSWSPDGRFILAAVGEGDADIILLDGLVNGRRE